MRRTVKSRNLRPRYYSHYCAVNASAKIALRSATLRLLQFSWCDLSSFLRASRFFSADDRSRWNISIFRLRRGRSIRSTCAENDIGVRCRGFRGFRESSSISETRGGSRQISRSWHGEQPQPSRANHQKASEPPAYTGCPVTVPAVPSNGR